MIDLTLDEVDRCQAILAGELCNTPIRWNERLGWIHCPNGQEQGGGWQHQAVPPTKEES